MSKYFNNALVGNSMILASLTEKGELIRLYYPNIDYFQNIDTYKMGLAENKEIFWLNDGYKIEQFYEDCILHTKLSVNNIDVEQIDYVLEDRNVLVRTLKFSKATNLFLYSKLNSNVDKLVSGMVVQDALIQYCQDMFMATFSDKKIDKYQINNAQNAMNDCILDAKDYIGMSADSAILYENVQDLTLYIALENNQKDILETIKWLKNQNEIKIRQLTLKQYSEFVKKLKPKIDKKRSEKEQKIIDRSIYLFRTLSDKNTGGILACPDVDESFTKCGRYGYCWARDALFITKALAELGMDDNIKRFYDIWVPKAQLENGMFEQRYYTNGKLAPSWGIQIDETSSIIIGMKEQTKCRDKEKIIVGAVNGILSYIDENSLNKECYDLWEERKGVHLYTTASMYKALKDGKVMLSKINKIKYQKLISLIDKTLPQMKNAISKNFVEKGVLKRSLDNTLMDISNISPAVPFEIFDVNDVVVKNTVLEIERKLKLENGGYLRYEEDNYIGGNAWIISSLWLALYYIKANRRDEAKRLFDWVTIHADELDFLPEQIEKNGDKTAWISALAWSHAMYVIVSNQL